MELVFEAFLRALGELIAGLVSVLVFVVESCYLAFSAVAELLWYCAKQLWICIEPLLIAVGTLTIAAAERLCSMVTSSFAWTISIKDDLLGEEETETSSLLVIAKLTVIITVSTVAIIVPLLLGIEFIRRAHE